MNTTITGVEMQMSRLRSDYDDIDDHKSRAVIEDLEVKLAVLEKSLD